MSTIELQSRGFRFAIATRVLALALATLSMTDNVAAEGRVSPAAARAAEMPLASLERAFWWCDYAATTNGVGAEDGAACTAVFDELKKRRFGGDFDKLVAWWRDRKPAEHRKLELAQGEDAELTADEDGLATP